MSGGCGENSVLEEYVHKFSKRIDFVKSPDGFLIKLSTLLYKLKENCYDQRDIISAVGYILNHPLIKLKILYFSKYSDHIFRTVKNDPRFSDLKIVQKILKKILRSYTISELRNIASELRSYDNGEAICLNQLFREFLRNKIVEGVGKAKDIDGILELIRDTHLVLHQLCPRQSKSMIRDLFISESVARKATHLFSDKMKTELILSKLNSKYSYISELINEIFNYYRKIYLIEKNKEERLVALIREMNRRADHGDESGKGMEYSIPIKRGRRIGYIPINLQERDHIIMEKRSSGDGLYRHERESKTTDRLKTRKTKKKVKILAVVLCVSIVVMFIFYPSLGVDLLKLLSVEGNIDKREILKQVINVTLNTINEVRAEHGIPPVKLINLSIAQFRAESMINKSYFGHCDLKGRIPSYWYTLLGGLYYFEENLGIKAKYKIVYGDITSSDYIVPEIMSTDEILEYTRRLILNMVYDDADSGWGHRDSILDPTNNYVDIGADWKEGVFILAIHMEKIWVDWVEKPLYSNHRFTASGKITLENSSLGLIVIYYSENKVYSNGGYDEYSTLEHLGDLTDLMSYYTIRNEINFTCSSYSLGTDVAVIVPPGIYGNSYWVYKGQNLVKINRISVNGSYFCIDLTLNINNAGGEGVYTIVLYARNTLGITHPYDPERYKDYVPILEYSIES